MLAVGLSVGVLCCFFLLSVKYWVREASVLRRLLKCSAAFFPRVGKPQGLSGRLVLFLSRYHRFLVPDWLVFLLLLFSGIGSNTCSQNIVNLVGR